jgi:ABC-2 type transport system permease protein
MWASLVGVARKEFIQTSRDRTLVKRLALGQMTNFLSLAFMDTTVKHVPTVIVDQDHTSASREIVERIMATNVFDLKYATSSIDQAREHIRAARAQVAVVVPPDYARARSSGDTARVLVMADGSNNVLSAAAAGAVSGVTGQMNLEIQHEFAEEGATVTPHSVLLFNPQGISSHFILPGMLALIICGIYSGSSMRSIIIERQMGNLERVLMTPLSYPGFIVGKLAPWFVICIINAILFVLTMRFAMGVPIRGSSTLLLFALILYGITVVALGALLGGALKDMNKGSTAVSLLMFPPVMLSGYLFPLASLPRWLLPVSYLMPQTHFVEIMRGICLRGASASELLPELIYFMVVPVLLIAGAAYAFRRSVLE